MATPAPDALLSLVERFAKHAEYYCSGQYKETDLRNDFIDPFFEALGWDVYNRKGYDPSHRQVVRETRLMVEGSSRAPDYSFRTGSQREFFVEAKHPGHNLDKDPLPAFQIRRYAWNAGLPVSILTDFDEFCVFNSMLRPRETDKPYTGRIRYLRYTDYPAEWQWLADNFSFEAVQKGSLRALAGDKGMLKGTARVDDAFLEDIERWRILLAKSIALRNKGIKKLDDLNYVVQATLDRIVFLRICEDRGIETGAQLKSLLDGDHIYRSLFQRFQAADERYNSGLFYFTQEKARRERVDEISARLKIDDAPLKEIISGLYPPKSPYEFSVMPADVLGRVYEQFLGKVIKLTAGHHAKVEEKPEVRKAGGVYYTPTYIVDYIVKNTVGKLLEGKTPKGALKLRILDPACGSGSFLIGAYQYLLDWSRDWYFRDGPDKHRDVLYQAGDDDWRLRVQARKDILTSCIFGVDIDRQAVEVTKLSLLLKVLEGETAETVKAQLSAFPGRALPDLGSNIKCGNSLVGLDFFPAMQADLFRDKDKDKENDLRTRIKPFNWDDEFPHVIRHSERSKGSRSDGFDAVIGNPPYIDSEIMSLLQPETRTYCVSHYAAASGNWDIFCAFVERTLTLCKQDGLASLIVPNKLLSADYAQGARRVLATDNRLLSVRDYSRVPVFPVAVYPVVFAAKRGRGRSRPVLYERMETPTTAASETGIDYALFSAPDEPWPTGSDANQHALLRRLRRSFSKLSELAEVTGAATVSEAYDMQGLFAEADRSTTKALRVVNSGTVDRYATLWGLKPMRYLGRTFLRPIVPPNRERRLPARRLAQARRPKVIVAGMTLRLECTLDTDGSVLAAKSTTLVFSKQALRYLCGVLNSSLISFYYRHSFEGISLSGGYLRVGPPQLETIPIALPKKDSSAGKVRYDRMVEMVEKMHDLHKRLQNAKSQSDKEALERQVMATDRQIDALAYELYGLTEAEIAIVEGRTR